MALEVFNLHETRWDEVIGKYRHEPYSEKAYLRAVSSLSGALPVIARSRGDGWEGTYAFLLCPIASEWKMVRTAEYGGPLIHCSSHHSDARKAAVEFRAQLDEYFLSEGVIEEVIMLSPWLPHLDVVAEAWDCRSEKRICLVALDALDEKWKGLSRGRRSDITRARRQSVFRIQPFEGKSVREFSERYHEAMVRLESRDRWRLDESHFLQIADHLRDRLFLSEAQGPRGGAGALFLHGEQHAAYFLAARWGHQSGTPSLVLWEGLQHLRQQGVKEVLLGGGVSSSEDDTLLKFKFSFSTHRTWLSLGGRIYQPDKVDTAIAGGHLRPPPTAARVIE